MRLRGYQADILHQVVSTNSNDLVQLDTGAGKTPIEAALARDAGHCIVVAHRNLLIAQISAKLAVFGVRHGIIGTEHTQRCCLIEQRRQGALLATHAESTVWVASIDSMMARARLLADDPSCPA